MEGNSLRTFENLCKIFEMRIKLNQEKNIETEEEVLDNYEKYSKKIDTIYNSKFAEEIKPLISPALTLEEEQKRLEKLIDLLEERLDKRNLLEDRFYTVTGNYIKTLQPIVSESELSEKKERLELITKYLDTSREIENNLEDIAKLKNDLDISEERKEKYLTKNKIMEDELYTLFTNIIKEDDFYLKLNEDDLDKELVKATDKSKETEETLEVTKDSVSSLFQNGIGEDYSSYIEDAEKSHYLWKNRELVLKIYDLVIKLDDSFDEMYEKRKKISTLLNERSKIREKLNIDTIDELYDFEKLLEEQINILEAEKDVLEEINICTNRITFKEEKLGELEEINRSVEVLAILREYGLIDTYEIEDTMNGDPIPSSELFDEATIEEVTTEEPLEENVVLEVLDPYRIVKVIDYPKTLNIGLAKLKGESVREKVNKKLNPKAYEPVYEEKVPDIEESKIIPEIIIPDNSKKDPEITTPEESLEVDASTIGPELPSEDEVISEESKVVIPEPSQNEEENSSSSTIPVWSLPTDTTAINIDGNEEEHSSNLDLPIWNEANIPLSNEDPKVDITTTNIESQSNNNSFWIPVSESKLETDQFPSINVPIQNNFTNQTDNFGFPSINN